MNLPAIESSSSTLSQDFAIMIISNYYIFPPATTPSPTKTLHGQASLVDNGVQCLNITMVVGCRTIQDPSAQKLVWCKAPLSVLVIRKPGDCDIHLPYKNVIEYLISVSIKYYKIMQIV